MYAQRFFTSYFFITKWRQGSEVTTRDIKMEYLGILKEVKTFFRGLVVFVKDNFVCS